MNKHIDGVEFTIFDTETTGLFSQSGDRIVEIAALKVKGDKEISKFQSLVNPGRLISPGAFEVNRITQEMLEDAPAMERIIPDFLGFIQDSVLATYNAPFDLGFLNNELKLCGHESLDGVLVIDILQMARRLLPGLERHALWFVAESLGIRIKQEHRAFSDVILSWEVFKKLKDLLKAKKIHDFSNVSSLFGINAYFLDDLNNQKITQIQQAIDLGVKLKIRYLAGVDASVSCREVIPKEIRRDRERSYLVGYCCLRNDERTFRIDGILHIEIV
ncbi:MAG: WYL domain-containing protein [Candidatus Omnitrophica bacterium]|nr:WYL domain-containing protein [Candidatus Omnitrophota bacterium]